MALNERQIRFCDAYLANGGKPMQAAKEAGYAETTARYAAEWLNPKNQPKPTGKYDPEMAEYIAEHSNELERHNSKIVTAEELQEFTSAVIRGEVSETVVSASGKKVEVPVSIKDRLKGADMMAKMKGLYTTKIDADIREVVIIDDF